MLLRSVFLAITSACSKFSFFVPTINMTHMHVILIHDLILGIICITLHVMIFIRSRAAIRKQSKQFRQTSMALPFLQNPSNANKIPSKSIFLPSRSPLKINSFPHLSGNLYARRNLRLFKTLLFHVVTNAENGKQLQEANATGNAITNQLDCELDDIDCFSWFFNRPKLNRLEIRAALSMSINMIPFCFCTFPVTLNAITIYWCIRLQTNCPTVSRINPYLTDLFLIHIV
jgi:5-hydroxytryptamine receptor 1